jgi:hypothetical protein
MNANEREWAKPVTDSPAGNRDRLSRADSLGATHSILFAFFAF